MPHWPIENWLTLISAVTAAIVSVINALRGQRLEQKVDAHEERATARAAMTMMAPTRLQQPAPPVITDSMGIKPPGECE